MKSKISCGYSPRQRVHPVHRHDLPIRHKVSRHSPGKGLCDVRSNLNAPEPTTTKRKNPSTTGPTGNLFFFLCRAAATTVGSATLFAPGRYQNTVNQAHCVAPHTRHKSGPQSRLIVDDHVCPSAPIQTVCLRDIAGRHPKARTEAAQARAQTRVQYQTVIRQAIRPGLTKVCVGCKTRQTGRPPSAERGQDPRRKSAPCPFATPHARSQHPAAPGPRAPPTSQKLSATVPRRVTLLWKRSLL